MTASSYASLLDLAAGGLLLAAVLIVWRRELTAIVRLLAWQGLALAAMPLVEGIHAHDSALIMVGVGVFTLRAVVLAALLARAGGADGQERRLRKPLVNHAST